MKLIELDSHLIIEGFRKEANSLVNHPGEVYHLIVPPEYNIPPDFSEPLQYLFAESASEQGILRQYGEGKYVLEMRDGKLFPREGFDHSESCRLLQATPCTTTNGFSFEMHETASNPFMPSPEPPLCDEIQRAFDNPATALEFLRSQIRTNDLKPELENLEKKSRTMEINMKTRDDVVAVMQDAMNRISDIVFEVKPFKYIPTLFKVRTNYLIFYAVTGMFHKQLLAAYHTSMKSENSQAARAMKEPHESLGDPEKLNLAAECLDSLEYMSSVYSGIDMVKKFFDGVLKSLPEKNAAADDILPAVCDGMCRVSRGQRLASALQYLADVWPPEGLEEKVTYVLTTCAIAASHLAMGRRERKAPVVEKKPAPAPVPTQDSETIQIIEELLELTNEK